MFFINRGIFINVESNLLMLNPIGTAKRGDISVFDIDLFSEILNGWNCAQSVNRLNILYSSTVVIRVYNFVHHCLTIWGIDLIFKAIMILCLQCISPRVKCFNYSFSVVIIWNDTLISLYNGYNLLTDIL